MIISQHKNVIKSLATRSKTGHQL